MTKPQNKVSQIPSIVANSLEAIDNKLPLVSIVCITYNHVHFIEEALNSFLMQKASFSVEILVGEDCSTDGTREIVYNYSRKYPNVIKVISSNHNVGVIANAYRTLKGVRGKYIALCDGDDYWIDPHKLQKQVDYLENESLDACCTLWNELRGNNLVKCGFIPYGKLIGETHIMNPNDYNYYHTSTRIINSNVFSDIINKYPFHLLVDSFLWYVLNEYYKVGVLLENSSVYRISGLGTWSSFSDKQKDKSHYELYKNLQFYIPHKATQFSKEKWFYWLKLYFPRYTKYLRKYALKIALIEAYITKIKHDYTRFS